MTFIKSSILFILLLLIFCAPKYEIHQHGLKEPVECYYGNKIIAIDTANNLLQVKVKK
jgi:hypothetical protein